MASIPFGVISILSRPRKVDSRALGRSFFDMYSGYSLSRVSKYRSQNLEHSIPPCPSNTAKTPMPLSNYGLTMCASSYKAEKSKLIMTLTRFDVEKHELTKDLCISISF